MKLPAIAVLGILITVARAQNIAGLTGIQAMANVNLPPGSVKEAVDWPTRKADSFIDEIKSWFT